MGRKHKNLEWDIPTNGISDDPYVNLGFAIVLKACSDYKYYLRCEKKAIPAPAYYTSAKTFLRSPWPEYYTGIPGKVLMQKVKEAFEDEWKEAADHQRQRMDL